jgi:hypothetical protein
MIVICQAHTVDIMYPIFLLLLAGLLEVEHLNKIFKWNSTL